MAIYKVFTGDDERDILIARLKECGGNVSQLAAMCGYSARTMWRKLREHAIDPNEFREVPLRRFGRPERKTQ